MEFCWCGAPARAKDLCEKHYREHQRNRKKVKIPRAVRRKFR
jgi:hypothetical protein